MVKGNIVHDNHWWLLQKSKKFCQKIEKIYGLDGSLLNDIMDYALFGHGHDEGNISSSAVKSRYRRAPRLEKVPG